MTNYKNIKGLTLLALIGASYAQEDFYFGEYAAIPFDGYFDLDN